MIQVVQSHLRKIIPVFSNGVYLLLPGLANQLLAFFVMAFSGNQSWGEIVQLQLYYYLATAIIAWGNKEYLLVQFSRDPAKLPELWQQSLSTRALILMLPALLVTLACYPLLISVHVCCWMLMRFFTQSFESVAVFRKKYNTVLLSELAAFLPLLLLFVNKNLSGIAAYLMIISMCHALRAIVLFNGYSALLKAISRPVVSIKTLTQSLPFMLLALAGYLQAKSDLYCVGLMMEKSSIGNYQVLMSYVSLGLLIPGFLYTPYIKDFYQQQAGAVKKLQSRLNKIGIMAGMAGIVMIYPVMQYIYHLEFSFLIYGLAAVYVISPYLFMPYIYSLFRDNAQLLVLKISFAGIAANASACFALIPFWGITGALLANLLSQLFLWFCYRFFWIRFNKTER